MILGLRRQYLQPKDALQRHIVPVDQSGAARITEKRFDRVALMTFDDLSFFGGIAAQAKAELTPVGVGDRHRITAPEIACDRLNSGR